MREVMVSISANKKTIFRASKNEIRSINAMKIYDEQFIPPFTGFAWRNRRSVKLTLYWPLVILLV